ncbi:organic cation transporter protein [Dendroctonus ponderosae]|uniref:organic cation transporter protein n=1 Tax=Dendroctonus ponderosae TaxID=77166 RepID=UPI002035B857|nr:organic cation transporter protein [Dendroctonus ponderosae]KAH1012958.1 hypothetical protein HUJ05_012022 [Dendroctonus ponderosae]
MHFSCSSFLNMSANCESDRDKDQEASLPANTDNDRIQETIGDFGKWQLKISILMSLIKFPIAWFQMSIVFLAPPTNFWCKKPDIYENRTDEEWQSLIKPAAKYIMQTGINRGYCFMKNLTADYNNNTQELIECSSFSYNRSVFVSTITSEWDLVCSRQKLMDMSQVTLMIGVLLGNIFCGILADKHGRKNILMVCLLLQSVLGIFASITPYFPLFVFIRFCLALANGGTMVISFVMCMEVVGGKWRTIVSILYQVPFGFGYALLSGIAYLLRDWRNFHFAISLLSMLYVGLYWLVPESPRWLLAIGRTKDAQKILIKAAKENNIKLINMDETFSKSVNRLTSRDNRKTIKFKDLFSTRELRKRSCLIIINWFIAGMQFFGFIQYIGYISDNLFFTVAVGALTSLPGTVLSVFLVSNYGRKLTIIYAFLLTASCSFLILAFPKGAFSFDWPRIVLAGTGIIGISVSIPAMYLFTGELFPTVLRNSGVGLAMMFSRLGSIIAPLLVSLQNVAHFLPLLVMGIVAIIQAVLVLFLPETQGKKLPDTIEDLEIRKYHSNNDAQMDEERKNIPLI